MAAVTCSSVLACGFSAADLTSKVTRPARPVTPLRNILPVIKAQTPELGRRATLSGLALGGAALLLSNTWSSSAHAVLDKAELNPVVNEDKLAILGGWKLADPNDPVVVQIAEYTVSEQNKVAGTSLELISVFQAMTQVVDGTKFCLTISAKDAKTGATNDYKAIVLWRPWEELFQLISFYEIPSPSIPGGWSPIRDLKNAEVLKVAQFAVREHNKVINETVEFISVIQGESQVVSGVNYKLVISAKGTLSGKISYYEAVVLSQPWNDFQKLISFKEYDDPIVCEYVAKPKLSNMKAADSVEVSIAKFAVSEHNLQAGVNLEFKYLISSVPTQMVSGTNYDMRLVAEDVSTAKSSVCVAVVWSQPSQGILKLISFKQLLK